VVDEHVDRAEGLADRRETLPDLLDVGDVGRDREPLARVRQVGREVLDVLRRAGEQRDPTPLGRESPGERFTETGTDAGDDSSTWHGDRSAASIKTVVMAVGSSRTASAQVPTRTSERRTQYVVWVADPTSMSRSVVLGPSSSDSRW